MNLARFTVAQTNIFPIVNSKAGGQYVTEFNLRSRESVATDPNVDYFIGPSYTHSELDFKLSIASGTTSTIELAPGQCLLNGHYVQSLSPVTVDMLEVNKDFQLKGEAPLKGKLCIGLKAIYSTDITMAGSLLVEDDQGYYQGIQIVILPKSEFITPSMSPTNEGKVTAHLKIGEFTFNNGRITNVVDNYPEKCHIFDASRVSNITDIVGSQFITKNGLQSNRIYTFAGKPQTDDSESWEDYWCDSTDSLMIWDSEAIPVAGQSGINAAQIEIWKTYKEATFKYNPNTDTVSLIVPHKQVSKFTNTNGDELYYPPKFYQLPVADYNSGSGGVVNKEYTFQIKKIRELINEFYQFQDGDQRKFIPVLNNVDELPEINQNWRPGDYIIVGTDNTVGATTNTIKAPSTMYVVLPGLVTSIKYIDSTSGTVPTNFMGVEISRKIIDGAVEKLPANITTDAELYSDMFGVPSAIFRGRKQISNVSYEDYFVLEYQEVDTNGKPRFDDNGNRVVTLYYYAVTANDGMAYSDPVLLTGEVPLATESQIGGFYNCAETDTGAGYVIRDGNGHLRLLDYAYLTSGLLVYQLGEDWNIGSGLSIEEIQAQLDEYINERIAFANENKQNAVNDELKNQSPDPYKSDIYTINLNIKLPATNPSSNTITRQELFIHDIDSRFGTAVNIVISGDSVGDVKLNVINCQKIRVVNNTLPGKDQNDNLYPGLSINIQNCGLYYDSDIIGTSDIQDFSIWYKQYADTDPDLIIDGMNVIDNSGKIQSLSLDYWTAATDNDQHYYTALKSVRYDSATGNISGFGIYVRNNETSNLEEGKAIYASQYRVPQGTGLGLSYPESRLINPVKIDGSFITSYPSNTTNSSGTSTRLHINDLKFTLLSQTCNPSTELGYDPGTISFLVDRYFVDNYILPNDASGDPTYEIDGWSTNSYHQFEGGTTI